MKQAICSLLIFSLLLVFPGCVVTGPTLENPTPYYYLQAEPEWDTETGMIVIEQREAPIPGEDMQTVLQTYLQGPLTPALASPFPPGITLEGLRTEGNVMYVTLSAEFGELDGVALSTACACLALTGMALSGCNEVRISAPGLHWSGSDWITLHLSDLILTDDSVDRIRSNMAVYLTDSRGTQLISQPVAIRQGSCNRICADLITELIQGVPDLDLYSPLPPGTQLLGVSVLDGICTVNFSREFVDNISTETDLQGLALQSVTNTLAQLDFVTGVTFYCEGSRLLRYGALNTQEPWVWSSLFLRPTGEGSSFAATLYLSTDASPDPVLLPIQLKKSNAYAKADQVIHSLLHFREQNGYQSPIPADTALIQTSLNDGVCTVILSGDFLEQDEDLETALQAISASVCSLPEINSVRIVVDGQALFGPP